MKKPIDHIIKVFIYHQDFDKDVCMAASQGSLCNKLFYPINLTTAVLKIYSHN